MKLSFGMVGGGNGAFIGDVHLRGATMDHLAALQAGCFSRDLAKNRETAEAWGVADASRVYANYEEMAEQESRRADKIDFVSIVTPTDTHYAIARCFLEHGIAVMCDKPLAFTAEEGAALRALAKKNGLAFGVTYTYAAYAMVRQAREMIARGDIGRILNVIAEYPQDWLLVSSVAEKSDQAPWRLDPKRAGPSSCCADIGTHAEALISRMTGLRLQKVLARLTHFDGSPLEHDVQILLTYENGIPGMLWASQIAAGNDCGIKVRVFGERGSIEWSHLRPLELRVCLLNQPAQIYTVNREYDDASCREQCRLPAGHPEGFYEAFGNVYRSFCVQLLAQKTGNPPAGSFQYTDIDDGIAGLHFVEACLESDARGNVWVDVGGGSAT